MIIPLLLPPRDPPLRLLRVVLPEPLRFAPPELPLVAPPEPLRVVPVRLPEALPPLVDLPVSFCAMINSFCNALFPRCLSTAFPTCSRAQYCGSRLCLHPMRSAAYSGVQYDRISDVLPASSAGAFSHLAIQSHCTTTIGVCHEKTAHSFSEENECAAP
jgi:hypothetical protein